VLVCGFASVYAAPILSIVRDDSSGAATQPLIYDATTGAQIGSWVPDGAFPGPVPVQDQAYDPVTGDLFALTARGTFKRTLAGVESQATGFVGVTTGQGGDLAVSSALDLIVISRDDSSGASPNPLFRQMSTGANLGGYTPDGRAVADHAFDPTTNDLYSLTEAGVVRRIPSGATSTLAGVPGALIGLGGDITVGPLGVLSISLDDTADTNPKFYQTITGTPLGGWIPGGVVLDQAYDPVTGDLYALTTTGVFKRTPAGVQSQIPGISGVPIGQGGDITVFNQLAAVPEPSGIVLFGIGLVGLTVGGIRRR
jgi:hypothetical protein